MEALHDYINSLPGFHLRDGRVRKSRRRHREQKGVDVQLAVDAMEHAARGNMTNAVLLSGDLDFEPLLSSLNRLGVWTKLVYMPLRTSRELMRAADEITKVTLEDFHAWAAPSFRETHVAVRLRHRQAKPSAPIFVPVREGTWSDRQVTLFRAKNESDPLLYAERGHELTEASYTFQYPDIDKLPLAFELTFGPIAWH